MPLWKEVTRHISFEALTDPQRRLLPAVWKNLSAEYDTFPGCHQLRGVYRLTWARNLQQQKCCERVIEQLGEAGIPTIAMKGIALNIAVYQDLGMRPAHDFDLLVPFPQARQALELLNNSGWQFAEPQEYSPPELRLCQAIALGKDGFEFDLHWFALREARNPEHDTDLWERAVPLQVGAAQTKMLCPDHQLMHLLVNGTREPENSYRFLLDLKQFTREYGSEIDLPRVHRAMKERHLLHRISYLPLEEIECQHLRPETPTTPLDRVWSWCSRYVHDGTGEMEFGLFPFLDYLLHYAGRSDNPLTVLGYFQHQLKIESWSDFFSRFIGKFRRTLAG